MRNKILIVDDLAENRLLLASILKNNLDCDVLTANSGAELMEILSNKNLPDLILLDVMMPKIDGFQVAKQIKENSATAHIPIIFVTALSDKENIIRGFQSGGVDYISKPFNKYELIARVNTHLELRYALNDLADKNSMLQNREKHLVNLVEEKTIKIEKMTFAMVSALENVNLYNDTDTGNHIKRVSEYSAIIADGYDCNLDYVKRIKCYSSLHDIGKVGVPDNILKKPGKYTDEEFEQMKKHVIIGANMLSDPELDPMAKNIALYHHEKWDGTGYMKGLQGFEIPLAARIVAIADVFDALSTKRVYKDAFEDSKAISIIKEGSGKHFEPKIVDIFVSNIDAILEIKNKLR